MSDTTHLFAAFIVASQKGLGLTDQAFATMIAVSRSTIGRWKTGRTAPHPIAQHAIIKVLEEKMTAKFQKTDRFYCEFCECTLSGGNQRFCCDKGYDADKERNYEVCPFWHTPKSIQCEKPRGHIGICGKS